jgi:hypothetical protein
VHHVGSHSCQSGVAVYRAALVVVALAEAKRRQHLPYLVPYCCHLAQSPSAASRTFEFLASDHRAAADIGITRYDAEQSFDWPFRN